jgi:protein-S-isoprenylcysteine O-methyltransferase Ste14
MRGYLSAIYSACAYLVFFATFLFLIGFVENLIVPKSIDSGRPGSVGVALLVNVAVLVLFGLQHSVMARPAFKRVWTQIVPSEAERSTYVLAASLALIVVFWAWRPMPQLVWSIKQESVAMVLNGASWLGWGLVLLSTFLISHFHLFGLSQGFARLLKRKDASEPHFVTPSLYRWMRHPLYAGFILAFWAEPQMSLGHLVFAGVMTAYILIAIGFEERDLIAEFGERYLGYRKRVGMFWPKIGADRH